MTPIRQALKHFLAETAEGNTRSSSSPAYIIEMFTRHLDDCGHGDLNEFDRARFDKEWREDNRFCDMFGPDHIQPFHLNGFLGTFVIRKVMGTKGFLKACGPVMEKLAAWLLQQGHWNEKAMAYYRDLVGDKAGSDLGDCKELARALHDYVESHPVDDEDAESDDDEYFNNQLRIKQVEPGRLIFDGLLDGTDIAICLPKSVTSKAKVGWSVTMENAKIKGKWRILEMGNVYP